MRSVHSDSLLCAPSRVTGIDSAGGGFDDGPGGGAAVSTGGATYCAFKMTLMSVRRLSWRPASVSFEATGLSEPWPIVWNR